MTTAFPTIAPSSRSVTLGQFPVKRFTTIAGTGATRAYGSQPFNASLSLQYDNITDTLALEIVEAHEAAYGSKNALALPPEVWDGMDLNLRVRLERDYTWRFAEPPQLTSVHPGISSIGVKLEGQRDG